MGNKKEKRQKDNPQDKVKSQNKEIKKEVKNAFQPPPPKPFQQFSNPNKFSGGGSPKSFNAFHRRLGK